MTRSDISERSTSPAAIDATRPAKPLAHRTSDDELLAAKLVPLRRPGQWISAAALLVLFAMLVHTLVTNPRFQWDVVGRYFVRGSVVHGLILTLWLTGAVMTCG